MREVRELGVVAEQCPGCTRVTPCAVRAAYRRRSFFRPAAVPRETSCLCGACGLSFPCEPWRYPVLVPAAEAAALGPDELLARTNPRLAERLQLREQVGALGGDARFAVAYEQLDGMRAGELHRLLLQHLLVWDCLEECQRGRLAERVAECARAWQVVRQVAPEFPGHAGILPSFLAALAVGSAFAWAPAVRDWLWGTVIVVAGCTAAAVVSRVFLTRRVRQWAREVLIPAAERAKVSLPCLLGVIDDLPGTQQFVLDDTWPLKDQVETIRRVLAADGKL